MQLILTLFLASLTFSAMALTGDEVVEMIKAHNSGYGSETAEVSLILTDGKKTIAERKMKTKNLELNQGDFTSKSFLEFTHPKDVKGTKLLTWLQKKQEKSQWVYLPALGKKKRILSGSQSASFMGSEFTYEDIGGREVSHYQHKLLEEKKDGPDTIWKIEQHPKDKSIKSHEVLVIKKSLMSPVEILYFNERGEHFKSSRIEGFKEYKVNGKSFHRPGFISMKNLVTGKESKFEWHGRDFGRVLKESEFNPAILDLKR